MLHLKLWICHPIVSHKDYCGGNWFGECGPAGLVDPAEYLEPVLDDG